MGDEKKPVIAIVDTVGEVPRSFLGVLKDQYLRGERNILEDGRAIFGNENYIEGYSDICYQDRVILLTEYRLHLTLDEYRRFGKLFDIEGLVNSRIQALLSFVENQRRAIPEYPPIIHHFEFKPNYRQWG